MEKVCGHQAPNFSFFAKPDGKTSKGIRIKNSAL